MPGSIHGARPGATELPHITVMVFNPANGRGDPVRALVDTGASHCCLSADIARAFGLSIRSGHLTVNLASGSGNADSALVMLGFQATSGIPPAQLTINDLEVAVVSGMTSELILGWHVLQHFDLSFDRSGGFTLAWA